MELREPLQINWPGWVGVVGVAVGAGGLVAVAVGAGGVVEVAVAVGAGGVGVAVAVGSALGVRVGEAVGVEGGRVGVGVGAPSRPLQAVRKSATIIVARTGQSLREITLSLRFPGRLSVPRRRPDQ